MTGLTTALRAIAIVSLLLAIILPRPVTAATGPRLCNKTNEVVYVAIAWWASPLHSKGWYKFQPGECAQLFPDDSYDHHRYYYAESAMKVVWKGNAGDFCIHPTDRFEIADAYGGDCPPPYERRPFRLFSDNGVDLAS